MSLLTHIAQNFLLLKHDFIGISFSLSGVLEFLVTVVLALAIILTLFLTGEKIYFLIFKTFQKNIFLHLAFGFIIFGTGMVTLGILSNFYKETIIGYLFLFASIGIFPLSTLRERILKIFREVSKIIYIAKQRNSLLFWLIVSFVLLGFLKVLSPEIGVDGIVYARDFPREYLSLHSMMEAPKGVWYFITIPQLAQMLYVPMSIFNLPIGPRTIHFLFYILDLLLFAKITASFKNNFSLLLILFFVSSSVIINTNAFAFVDFQWILCWILTLWMLTTGNFSKKSMVLSGILFGGVLSSKDQGLIFFPAIVFYIIFTAWKQGFKKILSFISIFTFASLLIPSAWYLRSFLITGNPIYPLLSGKGSFNSFLAYQSLHKFFEKFFTLFTNYNPLLIISSLIAAILLFKSKHIVTKTFTLFLFILITYIFLPTWFFAGRYLMYLTTIIPILQIKNISFFKSRFFSYVSILVATAMILYYGVNTLLVLPYGLGWANKNAYLTRVLTLDNSSYYDFDHKFSTYITKDDYIATYRIFGFYYANFAYKDVAYFLTDKPKLQQLINHGVTKLLIKHVDMKQFCQVENLPDCDESRYTLLTVYSPAEQFLYKLNK